MSVWAWLVALVLVFALLLRGNVKGSKKYIVVAFLLLFCVMGLRDAYSVGNDTTTSYLFQFQSMKETAWNELSGKNGENFNLGFSYLMKVGYEFTKGDYQLFTAIVSAFIVFAYVHFIKKYSPSPVQSVLYFLGLLYYSMLFNALKQAVAMAILLFAYDAIVERKPWKFLILVLVASLFHFPALIFLPAYWIGNMKIRSSYVFLLAFILLVTYLLRDAILNLMLDAYGGSDLEATMEGVKFLRNKVIIMIIIVVAAIVLRPPTDDDRVYNSMLAFAGIAIVFQTFCGYNNIFERLADYYFHTSIVFIPLVFEKRNLKKRYLHPDIDRVIKTIAPILFCAFAIWRFISTNESDSSLSPYLFFFQNTM